jgi:hypothetical protein
MKLLGVTGIISSMSSIVTRMNFPRSYRRSLRKKEAALMILGNISGLDTGNLNDRSLLGGLSG